VVRNLQIILWCPFRVWRPHSNLRVHGGAATCGGQQLSERSTYCFFAPTETEMRLGFRVQGTHLLDVFPGAQVHAGDQVAVAAQVLGRALQDDVVADLQGPKVDRAREGVVDDGHQLVLAREGDDGLVVRDLRSNSRLGFTHLRACRVA